MGPVSPAPKRSPSIELIEKNGSDRSSDYLNISEPPAASKTPDPSSLFPLQRRASSNYQTALLGDKLQNVNFKNLNESLGDKEAKKDTEIDPLTASAPRNFQSQTSQVSEGAIDDEDNGDDDDDSTTDQIWSSEGEKRAMQRRSIGLQGGKYQGDPGFNVQYRGSVSYPPQSGHSETAPSLGNRSDVPRSYHSNQQSPIDQEASSSNDYFPRSFEYADFKRRMSKD